jgi:hypothetical protein
MRQIDLGKASTVELLSELLNQALNLQQDGRGASPWDIRSSGDLLLLDDLMACVTHQFRICGQQTTGLRQKLVQLLRVGIFPRDLIKVEVKEGSIRCSATTRRTASTSCSRRPGPVYDRDNCIYWAGENHFVVDNGREFLSPPLQSANVQIGTVDHAVWLEMINNGATVLLIQPAYDMDGEVMPGYVSPYIPVDSQRETLAESSNGSRRRATGRTASPRHSTLTSNAQPWRANLKEPGEQSWITPSER